MSKKKIKKKDVRGAIVRIFEKNKNKRYDAKEIGAILQIKDKNLRKLVLSILNDLKKEEYLDEFQRGVFSLKNDFRTSYTGTVDATQSGSAYIVVDGLEKDIFVAAPNVNRAFNGDEVEVEIIKRKKSKWEGKIVKIVQRHTTQFVGIIDMKEKYAFLTTSGGSNAVPDLYIPLAKLNGAKQGEKVLARMTSWPKGVNSPYGEVLEIIGLPGENNTEMLSILLKNEFSVPFSAAVMQEAQHIGTTLDPEEIKRRRDLRNVLTFTIDPVDAKDFDDALSFEKLENDTYRVGVHIADVSHFVTPGSALDEEAHQRGNSVYLEDRVIPMLPEEISNIACSLRPHEDKFTFSAIFDVDASGNVLKEWFGRTVIHSDRRFTYEEAQEVIEGKSAELKESITTLDKIAKILRKQRMENGALSIESEEIRFELDNDGNPIGVKKKIQKDANKLIEEFMLLANKRVALFVGKLPDGKGANPQFIYRCHDAPDLEKLHTFSVFIDKFNYDLEFKDTRNVAKKINAFLAKIKNTPEYEIIQTMAIRSMSKADYRTANIGHYGLAFDYYTHFTSPIRRYADLMVHRILFDTLQHTKKNYGNSLNEICKHISSQERKAIESERESNKFFQAKYIQNKVGETFEGTISGLADFGLFVRMNENSCEGMVRLRDLPGDTYYFDQEKFQIVGYNTKKIFNFGDQVDVKVQKVNLFKKEIDLKLL